MDIHQALNWRAIWPVLSELPADSPLSVLDAGCGNGAWCRRLARLRPHWRIVGIDRDSQKVQEGVRIEQREPLGNVTYLEGDFLEGVAGKYDLILSIAAIHYAAAEGSGVMVLRSFACALAPGGQLVLLVPRRSSDQPVWRGLPRPQGWPVFTPDDVNAIVTGAGLRVRKIEGLYGAWCVLGKQIAMWAAASRLKRLASLPMQGLVRATAFGLLQDPRKPSYALRVVAGWR